MLNNDFFYREAIMNNRYNKPDQVDNSRKKAYQVGALQNDEKFEDFVGKSDKRDFYQFKVEEKTDVDIKLGGLSGNADLYLLNNKGKLIEKSTKGGDSLENIERTLNPGAYYVKVQSNEEDANYTLSLDVGSGSQQEDKVGNNRKKAYKFGALKNDEKFEDFVGKSDKRDFYQFKVEEKTDVDIKLGGLSGNADLYLLNNKGKLIEKSTKGGDSLENIERTLNPGAYYVKVQSNEEDANYTLSLDVGSGSQQEDKVGNNRKKAYKFGALKNDEKFEDFVGKSDKRDFYQFKVEEKTDVDIKLGGLSGNADLYLLNNRGKVIEKSNKGGKRAEDIERTLNPGTYYVKVQSNDEDAKYTLSLDVGSGSKNLEKYEFTYYYSGSQDNEFQDYYSGYFYAPKGTYEVDSYYDFNEEKNEASANGKYYISSSSKAGAKAKDGEVYLESYYDLETKKEYVPYYASEDLPSGASGMGSEEDFIDFEKDEDVIELKQEGFFGADYSLANIVKEAQTSKSGDYQIDALLSPYKWGTNTITYSFYDNDSGPYYGAERDVGEVSDKVQEDIRHILENIYEPLSDLDFVEVADTSNSYGLIRIMKSSNPNYAYAYYPYADDYNAGNLLDLAGDVHFNVYYDGNGDHNNFQGGPGTHGYMTLIHELGHAVGLKHPHEDGDTLPENEDNTSNTVMSYNFTYTADNLRSYDVNALQYIYGFETPEDSVTVKSPNGGDTLKLGKSYTITWDDNFSENVKLELYKGGSFDSIITNSTASDGSYGWTLPTSMAIGSDYKVKITSVSDAGVSDLSDSNFTIERDGVITVKSPNGGDVINTGDTYNITWDDNISENVRIYLFQGNRYKQMISNSTPSDGSYSWTVPTSLTAGDNYEVAIQSVEKGSIYDYSDSSFTIEPDGVITVKSPNGGDVINTGDTYNITWDDNISENVRIYLFQGNRYKQMISNSTPSDGSYSWKVPTNLTTGGNYQVAIQSVEKDRIFDFSDSNFTIEPDGVITVKSPNGGDVINTGDTYNITWDDNISENVRIYLFQGNRYKQMISNSTPSDGSYSWTVPTSLTAGDNYEVAIQSVEKGSIYDYSDSSFTIEPDGVITVKSPNGGDVINTGDTYNITWDDNISENVRIYLFQGNRYKQMISNSTPSDGSYSWKVPTNLTTGGNYQVAIQSVEKGSLYDFSNSNFSIKTEDVSSDKYYFTYYYNVGDSYSGFLYEKSGTYSSDDILSVTSGFYQIDDIESGVGNKDDIGDVYISSYYDSNYTGNTYQPLLSRYGWRSGGNGLGSERDYLGFPSYQSFDSNNEFNGLI